MKNTYKILISICLLLVLSGCTQKTYTPVIESEFSLNAVYKTGDFSYFCKIVRSGETVSVTPLTTHAKGMTIKFDGAKVSFLKDGMKKEFKREDIDSANPAIIIYEVFSSLENAPEQKVRMKNSAFHYVGNTSVGTFTLIQNKSNTLRSISIPDAQIEIVFKVSPV